MCIEWNVWACDPHDDQRKNDRHPGFLCLIFVAWAKWLPLATNTVRETLIILTIMNINVIMQQTVISVSVMWDIEKFQARLLAYIWS